MADGRLDAVVHGAEELVVGPAGGGSLPATDGSPPAPGDVLDVREDAAVAVVDGEVAAVGPTAEVTDRYPPADAATAASVRTSSTSPGSGGDPSVAGAGPSPAGPATSSSAP